MADPKPSSGAVAAATSHRYFHPLHRAATPFPETRPNHP